MTVIDVVFMAIRLGHAKKAYDADLDIDLDGKVTAKDLVFVVKCRNEEKRHDRGGAPTVDRHRRR